MVNRWVRLGSVFWVLVFFMSPVAYAFHSDEKVSANPSDNFSDSLSNNPAETASDSVPIVIEFQSLSNGGMACRLSQLTPEEVQAFKDSILTDGLVGNEISSGTSPNSDRETISDENKLIIPNPIDGETAFQKEVPVGVLEPSEISPLLNKRISGAAFSFGVSMDDSLRTARCENFDSNGCAAIGKRLELRNSGEGIVNNAVNIFDSFEGDIESSSPSFSEEESAYLQAEIQTNQILETEDANTLNIDVLRRVPNNDLMNSIISENTFSSSLLTNCENSSCITALYSMFDKYFNSWFSGELVLSTFGPTAWGQFRKMLTKAGKKNLLPASLASKLNIKNLYKDLKISSKISNKERGLVPSDFFATVANPKGDIAWKNIRKLGIEFDSKVNDAYNEMKTALLSSSDWSKLESKLFTADEFLGKIKTAEDRQKIFSVFTKMKEYANANRKIAEAIEDGFKKGRLTKLDSIKGEMALIEDWDDALGIAGTNAIRGNPVVKDGLAGVYLKDASTGNLIALTEKNAEKYFDELFDEFVKVKDGGYIDNFKEIKLSQKYQGDLNPAGGFIEGRADQFVEGTADEMAVQLYMKRANYPVGTVQEELIKNNKYVPTLNVRLSNGRVVPANSSSLNDIVADYHQAGTWPPLVTSEAIPSKTKLTHEELANYLNAGNDWHKKITTLNRNIDSLYDKAVNEGWAPGKYGNLLSQRLQMQSKLISGYFSPFNRPDILNSGVGWTLQTYAYWWITRGFGSEDFSLYRLPKEFTQIKFYLGEQEIYKSAYIDFFANEGSDTGDIFKQVIEKLPYQVIIDYVTSKWEPTNNAWETFTGQKGRSEVDNLALFMFGPETCNDCSISIDSPSLEESNIFYHSPESFNGFLLEDAESKEAKEEGQLVSLFAHKMNVSGQLSGEPLDPIDLVKGREDEETCEQIAEEIPFYGGLAKMFSADKVALGFATVEAVSYYFVGGWGGAFMTLANQIVLAPRLNGCVDDKEGYFASIFMPREDGSDKGKADDLQKAANEGLLDGIRNFATQLENENDPNSLSGKVLNEATSKVKETIDSVQKNKVVEAEIRLEGGSIGNIESKKPIYFWVGGDGVFQNTRYSNQGKTVISTSDGDTITIDNENGTLSSNGVEIIGSENEDHVRLAETDLRIPGISIPNRLAGFVLDDSNRLLLTVNVRAEAIVQDASLLGCIQEAVLDQSGVPLNSNNLGEAFGPTEAVATDTYPNITFSNNRIIMGGIAPQIASSSIASVQIFSDRSVLVTGADNPKAGNLNSVLLENGSLIYKPQTNELLIWLRHHENAEVSADDVKNFGGTLTNTTNANTLCEEPAIDLFVETDPSTPLTKLKGDNLTASLEKNGPFQVFETDTKRFILYSKLVDGECKDFFKVIDKVTGEEYDQEIRNISQNDDGTIQITTEDGLTHDLNFSDENGKPVLTYDGKSELLRSAIGKNGSFYYDPNRGLYIAENGQIIPLQDNFKNQGVSFQANPDGSVSGKAGNNVFVVNPSQDSGGLFNIPSIPEETAGMALVIGLMGLTAMGIFLDRRNRKSQA